MVNLGTLYMSGLGVAKDDVRTVALYSMAASERHALAQVNLGDMYHWGRGVERDDDKAVVWYREASEQGEFQGLLKMAMAYRDGIGVIADPVLAYVFAIHDPKVRKIDLVEGA
ncbi:MAG: tetratricopeptide repeat protein [Hyphomicrobiaceae bacterium]